MARWFHRNLNGVDAAQLLMEKGRVGSFLVRKSHSQQNGAQYAITVRRKNDVVHIMVYHHEESFDLGCPDAFASLTELIEHYQTNAIHENSGEVIELKYPFYVEEDVITERWFHEGISGTEAEKSLMEKGKDGSFLVRVSQRSMESYVVSARVGNRVSHVLIQRNADNGMYNVGGGKDFKTVSELIQYYMKIPMVELSGSIITLVQPLNTTRINVLSLAERMQELQKVNSRRTRCGFSEEFEELQSESHEGAKSRRIQGELEMNRCKNRYRNILPFDDTRVLLHEGSTSNSVSILASSGEDYINANYISAPSKQAYPDLQMRCDRKYIATQGPLTNTIVDFWRMVWQENSRVIVMITKFIENKKAKCEPYWPNNIDEVGIHRMPSGAILKVQLIHETPNTNYTVREFLFMKEDPNTPEVKYPPRTLHHFHFVAWPDRWTPEDPTHLLNFLHEVDEKQVQHEGPEPPMIVHCSAGIGRTGTYIAIDMLVQHLRASGLLHCDIDISRMIQSMRDQRSGMVQTEQQYRFVYKSILGEVDTMQRLAQMEEAVSRTGHNYTNICSGNSTTPVNMVPIPANKISTSPCRYDSHSQLPPQPPSTSVGADHDYVNVHQHMEGTSPPNTIPTDSRTIIPPRPPRRPAQPIH